MTSLKEKVLQYYSLVDSRSFDELFKLFADNIVYLRCEEKIEGINNFKKFYLKERSIVGKHNLEEVHILPKGVLTKGIFKGENEKKDKLVLKFVDFFYFDAQGKICKRETYLASGFNLTK